jgi:aminomethyltransferase
MKKTPLYQWHVDNGANMAPFGSYLMPLWYPQGVKKEHFSVIERAGLFDTSHMATLLIKGEDARLLLQNTFSKDLEKCIGIKKSPLCTDRCVYGVFLTENGYVLDDAIVYQMDETLFMVVVNAGMGAGLQEHLEKFTENASVTIADLSGTLGKIDIQGPLSAKILAELLQEPSSVFSSFPYFSCKGWFEPSDRSPVLLGNGTPILLSRTGYTGEFGFEIFLAGEYVNDVWKMLLDIGGENLISCGLAARDSLRAGAVLPLSHQDIGQWPFLNNPWQFALPLDDNGEFTKTFVGSAQLQQSENQFYTYAFAGYDPRKIPAGEESGVLDSSGQRIGEILTCTTDMAISRVDDVIVSMATSEKNGKPAAFQPKGLSCGFVKVEQKLDSGDTVFLTDGKRKVKVEIRTDIRPDRTARLPLHQMI